MAEVMTLKDAVGGTLIEVMVRPADQTSGIPVRNFDNVQPPGLNRQAAFGSGIYQAGVWERDVAVCNTHGSFASDAEAIAALDAAVLRVALFEWGAWVLPVAAGVGVVNRVLFTNGGHRARLRAIPASPHWRKLPAEKSGTGSQAGRVITGAGFAALDVGRLLVFANGLEALITTFTSSTTVGSDVEQTVASQAFAVHDAAVGLL